MRYVTCGMYGPIADCMQTSRDAENKDGDYPSVHGPIFRDMEEGLYYKGSVYYKGPAEYAVPEWAIRDMLTEIKTLIIKW